jgi:hypothetical protein
MNNPAASGGEFIPMEIKWFTYSMNLNPEQLHTLEFVLPIIRTHTTYILYY